MRRTGLLTILTLLLTLSMGCNGSGDSSTNAAGDQCEVQFKLPWGSIDVEEQSIVLGPKVGIITQATTPG